MKNTNFVNSSGWPEDDHYSSVYDLAILSNALIKIFQIYIPILQWRNLHIMKFST